MNRCLLDYLDICFSCFRKNGAWFSGRMSGWGPFGPGSIPGAPTLDRRIEFQPERLNRFATCSCDNF
jgi:hypothetical protein